MDAFDALLNRSSTSALREPAPEGEALDRILRTALRAPDHGRLRPWRFVLLRGNARAAFADVVADAVRRRDPAATDAFVDKQRSKFTRAPLVIALVARIVPSDKVPEVEQLLSLGAATMNLLNALHADGFGGVWITGATAYDPAVAQALGVDAPRVGAPGMDPDAEAGRERLLGFLLVGTPVAADRPAPSRPALAEHVSEWFAPAPA